MIGMSRWREPIKGLGTVAEIDHKGGETNDKKLERSYDTHGGDNFLFR